MASPAAVARRNAVATNRTKDLTARIAKSLGIELVPVTGANKGGAAFAQLSEREAVTANLERIADALESQRGSGAVSQKGAARAATKGATDEHQPDASVPAVPRSDQLR